MKLALKKKQLEIKRMEMGIEENEFKILERHEEIEKIEKNIEIQKDRILELKEELKGMKE